MKGAVHAVWGSNYYDCGFNDLVQQQLMDLSVYLINRLGCSKTTITHTYLTFIT